MKHLYRLLLRLYPAEYQGAFAAEMVETFAEASRDRVGRGRIAFFCFAIAEMMGLAGGLASEWAAKAAFRSEYITMLSRPEDNAAEPEERDARRQLTLAIRRMQYAIARHDFTKARLYSDEERALRARLRHLAG